jgi:hypothetical protein
MGLAIRLWEYATEQILIELGDNFLEDYKELAIGDCDNNTKGL